MVCILLTHQLRKFVWDPVCILGMQCAQEKQIRARQGMKQLSKRMMEQRMQALERLRRNMMGPSGQPVRILPRDMEQGLKEFASGVEQLVDRLVRRWMQMPACMEAPQMHHQGHLVCLVICNLGLKVKLISSTRGCR